MGNAKSDSVMFQRESIKNCKFSLKYILVQNVSSEFNALLSKLIDLLFLFFFYRIMILSITMQKMIRMM